VTIEDREFEEGVSITYYAEPDGEVENQDLLDWNGMLAEETMTVENPTDARNIVEEFVANVR
jgi:hypothetical protein